MYSSNTTTIVVRNLTVLSCTTDKRNRISNHFWDRWRHEYVAKLRETIRKSKLNINSKKNVNDKDIVQDFEKVPRHFWRIAIVTGVLPSRDSEIREALMRIEKDQYNSQTSRKLTFHSTYHDTNQTDKAREQKLRQEAAAIGELERIYECYLREHWEGEEESLSITNINLFIRFNKARAFS